jgi:hypothetical protein
MKRSVEQRIDRLNDQVVPGVEIREVVVCVHEIGKPVREIVIPIRRPVTIGKPGEVVAKCEKV